MGEGVFLKKIINELVLIIKIDENVQSTKDSKKVKKKKLYKYERVKTVVELNR